MEEAGVVHAAEIQRVKDQAQSDVDKAMAEKAEAEERAKSAQKEADKTLVDALKSKDAAQVNLEKALEREKTLIGQVNKANDKAEAREREISALREELKKLEEEAQEEAEQLAVTDPAEVEKAVAEAVEKEVAAEREKTAALEAENAKLRKAADPTVQKFTGLFEAWQEDWNRMQKVLQEADSQMSEKLKAALGKMLDIMKGKVGE